jgi:hypothetical protein
MHHQWRKISHPWIIDVAVQVDALTMSEMLLERTDFGPYPSVRQWAKFLVGSNSRIFCEAGVNNSSAFSVSSVADAMAPNESAVVTCKRDAAGEITVWKNGVDVSAIHSGSFSSVVVGLDQPFTVAYSNESGAGQAKPVVGAIYAIAIHGD